MLRLLTIAAVLLGCTACASKPPLEDNSDFAPIRPLEPAANALPTGSILGNNMHMSLFQGQRQGRFVEMGALDGVVVVGGLLAALVLGGLVLR